MNSLIVLSIQNCTHNGYWLTYYQADLTYLNSRGRGTGILGRLISLLGSGASVDTMLYAAQSLCPLFFYQIVFPPNVSPSKTMKCLLFYQKSSFRSRDTQNFAIFSLPFQMDK